ncbi:MAG TPA: class I SAM-dependent methyltransferase [Polyangiaceae bacterium]|nr:class I SAM-dependent methyltransferase [Polyangiaceae bacterium]
MGLVRCIDCSLIYVRSDDVGIGCAPDDDYIRTRILEAYNEPPPEQAGLFRSRLELAGAQLQGRRVLVIGCGNGAFLSTAKALGWQPRGLDISETPRDLLAPLGIDVCVDDAVEFLRAHVATFDLIHMNHSLEYIPAAAEVVLAARRALAPGGLFYLEVPNEFDNLVYRTLELIGRKRRRGSLFGRSVAPTLPSRHLYFFNKKSLERLALRAGFATFKLDARRREPFKLGLADAADTAAALLGAGSFLTLTANAPAGGACSRASSRGDVGLLRAPPGSCEYGACASPVASRPRPSR